MAQLEVYNGPQVQENMPAGNRQSAAGVGELVAAKGRQAQQVDQLGNVAGKIGDAVFEYEDKRAREDVQPFLRDLNIASDQMLAAGAQAAYRDKAKGFTDEQAAGFDGLVADIRKRIPDERTRMYFDSKVEDARNRHLTAANRHEVSEDLKYRAEGAQGNLDAIAGRIIGGKDDDIRDADVKEYFGLLKETQAITGLDPMKALQNTLGLTIVNRLQNTDNPREALDLLDRYSPLLDEKSAAEMRRNIMRPVAEHDGRELARTELASGKLLQAEIVAKAEKDAPEGYADQARQGALRAIGDYNYLRKEQANKIFSSLKDKVARGNLADINDAELSALSAVDPARANSLRDARRKFIENTARSGSGGNAEKDDEAKVNEITALIENGDITQPKQLNQYTPYITAATDKMFAKMITVKGELPPSKMKEAWESRGKSAGNKEYRNFQNFVLSNWNSGYRGDIGKLADEFNYSVRMKEDKWGDDPDTIGEAFAAGRRDFTVQTPSEKKAMMGDAAQNVVKGLRYLSASGDKRFAANALDLSNRAAAAYGAKDGVDDFFTLHGMGGSDWLNSRGRNDSAVELAAYAITKMLGKKLTTANVDSMAEFLLEQQRLEQEGVSK